MNNDKILNLLGMARRANMLSLGHDACQTSADLGTAQTVIVSKDASDRLKEEMKHLCDKKKINIVVSDYTMNELGISLGAKMTAVLSVNDAGFAKRINELTGRNNNI